MGDENNQYDDGMNISPLSNFYIIELCYEHAYYFIGSLPNLFQRAVGRSDTWCSDAAHCARGLKTRMWRKAAKCARTSS